MKRALLLLAAGAISARLGAATIKINNTNANGIGFNDNTAATPIGGNTGTTLGQQRLKAFEEAARIWGELLPSDVTITIDASFEPLECSATSAVIGSAGSRTVHSDFPGAILPDTWYPQALANKLSGVDQDTISDLRARFNSKLGQTGCLTGNGFYLGLDNNHPTNQIDLVTILLHEFGHGLGFATFSDGELGTLFHGTKDVYTRFLFDNTQRTGWDFMNDGERQSSALNDHNLVWAGQHATAFARSFLKKKPEMTVNSPDLVRGNYSVVTALFGAPLASPALTGTAVQALDAGNGSTTDGCEALTNASAVAGNIAVVDRGVCNFTVKVKNAQNAGAKAVIVVNNQPESLGAMSGTDDSLTIPTVLIQQAEGNRLKANLPASVTIGLSDSLQAGSDATGRVMVYAPTEFNRGSSISHFDVSTTPNTLMEPFYSSDSPHNVDATLELFRDIGWFGREQASPAPQPTWIVPSAARGHGAHGAFFTTDVTLSNGGTTAADVLLQFLPNGRDGREGPVQSVKIGAGATVTYNDILGSVFGVEADFGAVLISSGSSAISALGQTSTPPPDGLGTFGQSVPAAAGRDLVVSGVPRAIPGVTENAAFRSNLIVASATDGVIDVDVKELAEDGREIGNLHISKLQPFEMRQVSRIHQAIAGNSEIKNATLVLSSDTPGAAFAAYVAEIDNVTNDPRTFLTGAGVSGQLVLPSAARAPGRNNAFFTTDLTVANRGDREATVTLKFLGHDKDGTDGSEATFAIQAGSSRAFTDVLKTVFLTDQDFGALLITSTQPVVAIGQTATPPPDGQGTFGQSVPTFSGQDLVSNGAFKVIPGVSEDEKFRSNLIFVNTTRQDLEVEVTLKNADGGVVGNKKYALKPYEMRQIAQVVKELAPSSGSVNGASLVLSTATSGGTFAAYVARIDNVTNDPRTLLPK